VSYMAMTIEGFAEFETPRFRGLLDDLKALARIPGACLDPQVLEQAQTLEEAVLAFGHWEIEAAELDETTLVRLHYQGEDDLFAPLDIEASDAMLEAMARAARRLRVVLLDSTGEIVLYRAAGGRLLRSAGTVVPDGPCFVVGQGAERELQPHLLTVRASCTVRIHARDQEGAFATLAGLAPEDLAEAIVRAEVDPSLEPTPALP